MSGMNLDVKWVEYFWSMVWFCISVWLMIIYVWLHRYKLPRFILAIKEEFPTTSTGKVKKGDLKNLLLTWLAENGRSPKWPGQSTPPDSRGIPHAHSRLWNWDTKLKAHLLLLSAGFALPSPSWKRQYKGASYVHFWFKVLLVLRLRCLQPLHTSI